MQIKGKMKISEFTKKLTHSDIELGDDDERGAYVLFHNLGNGSLTLICFSDKVVLTHDTIVNVGDIDIKISESLNQAKPTRA